MDDGRSLSSPHEKGLNRTAITANPYPLLMIIGFLRDKNSAVSPIVPANIVKFAKLFDQVKIESGIGTGAFFMDKDYEGAQMSTRSEIIKASDVIVQITPNITNAEYTSTKESVIFIGQYAPFADADIVKTLEVAGINAFSLDMIPRTSLAQAMDILSSMASIAGYYAVLLASTHLPRYMPMMITAAGSIKPSKVLILGAGVAGLQAVATARRLGAIVEVFDTRTAVREEVQSLGAKFVEVEGAKDDKAAGGYAVEQTDEYKAKQAALIQKHATSADIVITTAQLRGKRAPLLITDATVQAMKKGSVIVDLASSTGGNCEGTIDQQVIQSYGVTIIGDSALHNRMPQDASTLYSNNLFNFLNHIVKDKTIDLASSDEILSKSLIAKK